MQLGFINDNFESVRNFQMKGFTLLELVVAMAILAVLIGLSILGIGTVQRSSRDTERKTVLKAISNELIDYFGNHQTYPPSSGIVFDTSTREVTINNLITLDLSQATNTLPAGETASNYNGSVYCYSRSNNNTEYSIGVSLESGNWYNLGSGTPCSSRNL